MLLFLMTALAFADANPSIAVTWKGDAGLLQVTPPAGDHVAPDATASATLHWGGRDLTWSSPGSALADGLALSGIRGQALKGDLRLSLCHDAGDLCRLVEVTVAGKVPDARKGTVALAVSTPAPPKATEAKSPFKADAAAAAKKAFAEAKRRGVPVLIDFAAVWCPPCNLLGAEVIESPAHAVLIGKYALLRVDVDDPSSFALKSRYHVAGYPTVVITDADGKEIDRVEGYGSEAQTVAWLKGVLEGAAPPDTSPQGQARAALHALEAGDTDNAKALLAKAVGAADTVAFREARLGVAPTLDDLRWLTAHAPEQADDWIWSGMDLAKQDGGKEALRAAARAGLRHVGPVQATDLLYLLGQEADAATAPSFYAAAAAAQRSAFTGNDAHDRGYWTGYAELLALSGDTDGAIAFLDKAEKAYPDEPTWTLTGARLLLDAKRPADALARVNRDWSKGWGDNRLRLALLKVQALKALGRGDEAVTFGKQVLAAEPAPAADVKVRAHRYRQKLLEAIEPPAAEAKSP